MKLFSLIKRLREDKIFLNSMIVSGFMIFGQLLSVIRDRFLIQYVGIGSELDIYNTAFRIPDLILAILMSLIASGTVIPFYNKEYLDGDNVNYNKKFNSSLILFLFLITLLCVIALIFMPFILSIFIKDFNNIDSETLIYLSRLLLIQPILLGSSILISTIGQIKERFILYSLSPIIYNLFIILGTLFLYKDFGLKGIIFGVIIGAVAHLLLQFIHFKYSDIKLSFSHFDWKYAKEHILLALPRSGSYIITELRNIFFTSISISAGASIYTIYRLAMNISNIGPAIIANGLSSSSIPRLSALYINHKYEEHNKLFLRNIISISCMMLCIMFILYLFCNNIVRIIYGNDPNIYNVVDFINSSLLYILFFALTLQFTTYFNSIKKPKMIMYSNIIGIILLIGHYYLWSDNTLSSVINLFLLSSVYLLLPQIYFYIKERISQGGYR